MATPASSAKMSLLDVVRVYIFLASFMTLCNSTRPSCAPSELPTADISLHAVPMLDSPASIASSSLCRTPVDHAASHVLLPYIGTRPPLLYPQLLCMALSRFRASRLPSTSSSRRLNAASAAATLFMGPWPPLRNGTRDKSNQPWPSDSVQATNQGCVVMTLPLVASANPRCLLCITIHPVSTHAAFTPSIRRRGPSPPASRLQGAGPPFCRTTRRHAS